MPYGYGYGYDQDYAPFNPGPGYGAMVPWGGYGGTYVGEPAPQPAPAEKGMLEKAQNFLTDKAVDDIPNWALIGGAIVIGTVWYGYAQLGWFE